MRTFNKKNWVISQLRRVSLRYPPRISVLNKAKTTYYIISKKGTQVKRVSFQCAICGTKDLKSKEVNVDHIIPIVSSSGWTNFDDFINGLFCDESNLQCICLSCHNKKSQQEQLVRTDARNVLDKGKGE